MLLQPKKMLLWFQWYAAYEAKTCMARERLEMIAWSRLVNWWERHLIKCLVARLTVMQWLSQTWSGRVWYRQVAGELWRCSVSFRPVGIRGESVSQLIQLWCNNVKCNIWRPTASALYDKTWAEEIVYNCSVRCFGMILIVGEYFDRAKLADVSI
jgi:hypothetical protein